MEDMSPSGAKTLIGMRNLIWIVYEFNVFKKLIIQKRADFHRERDACTGFYDFSFIIIAIYY